MEVPLDKIIHVKNKPVIAGAIELRAIDDLIKLIEIGNLVCLYEEGNEKLYFVQNFILRQLSNR